MNTVLITGCSTGFGRETAAHFLEQGWGVVATMRDPSASTLPASERLRVLPLDVTDADSIAAPPPVALKAPSCGTAHRPIPPDASTSCAISDYADRLGVSTNKDLHEKLPFDWTGSLWN